MNRFVDARHVESVHELALGVEAIDAAREQPMLMPVMLTWDDLPLGNPRPRFERHPSNRQVLLYDAHLAAQPRSVDLRLFDQTEALYAPDADRRRFVPRRLRVNLPSLAGAQAQPPAARLCRPHLYPGPAYPVSNLVTGVRAHAMRAPTATLALRPARWVRVLATVPAAQPVLALSTIVGRAGGDARGEFLLLLRFDVAAIAIDPLLSVRLRVFAGPELLPATPDLPAIDPLWDLPRETAASLADSDPVLRGEALPAGYVEVIQRVLPLPLGQLLRGQPHLTF
ncbi:MAG: hypothetical protein Q8N44_12365 [Rubrivivax sp.]|nr:hypothetical protein [Rubrivivax sp.]